MVAFKCLNEFENRILIFLSCGLYQNASWQIISQTTSFDFDFAPQSLRFKKKQK